MNFTKQVHQQSITKGGKFSEEKLAEIFNNSSSGQVRTAFFLWFGDLNRIINDVKIILNDLSELRKEKKLIEWQPSNKK